MIPILSAPPAPSAVPTQPAAAGVSRNSPDSFASYLKSVEGRHSDEPSQDHGLTVTKLSTVVKDKAGKDAKRSEDEKKKQLLTETASVPLPLLPASESKPFQISWPLGKSGVKGEDNRSSQSAAAADNASAQLAGQTPELNTSALKTSVAEARVSAPVAFGVNISKVDGLKTENLKVNEARPKTASAEATSGKPAAQVSKPAESKNSSGNQQRHSDSSSDDDQRSLSANAVKTTGAPASTQAEGLAALHATAAPSSSQIPAAATTVQNAYASPQAAAPIKAASVAPTAAVVETPQTPAIRSQNIDLKIPGADNSQVDVRVSQRAGDVQVTVRTPDGELAQSLRQHLPELSDRLSQTGATGNVWQPLAAQTANTGGHDTDSRYSDDAQTQQQNQQQHSRGNSNHGSQQQENETSQPAWLNELNKAGKEAN